MRAKLIGYKSCGAIWQQSASLTRCRGRTAEPHTQVIWLTCSWLTTNAVCLCVRGSVCASLRADAAVTVGKRIRGGGEGGGEGEEELPSAPSREFGHREGKLGGGEEEREFLALVLARRQSVRGCRAGARTLTASSASDIPQNSCMCGKSASFQHLKLLLSSQRTRQP